MSIIFFNSAKDIIDTNVKYFDIVVITTIATCKSIEIFVSLNTISYFLFTVLRRQLANVFCNKLAFKFKAIPHFKSIGHATEN